MDMNILIDNLQLANRHPGISDMMKAHVERIARKFQAAIVEKHPQADTLIEMGWNTHFDVDEYGDFIEDEDEDFPDLGRCCGCGIEGKAVRNIMMLGYKAPEAGKGWGCLQCGLPPDGANMVLCDECFEAEKYSEIVVGYAGENKRMAYDEFMKTAEAFDHDMSKHPEAQMSIFELEVDDWDDEDLNEWDDDYDDPFDRDYADYDEPDDDEFPGADAAEMWGDE